MAGLLDKRQLPRSSNFQQYRSKGRNAEYPYDRFLTIAGAMNCTGLGTVAAGVNLLHTVPLHSQGGVIYSVSFEVTTGGAAGSVARVGIFANTDEPNMFYPERLLFDSQSISTTGTGVKTSVCNTMVPPGLSCWIAYIAGTAAPTIRTIAVAATYGECYAQSNLSTNYTYISTSFTYGDLPIRYPIATTHGSNSVFPAIAIDWER